MVNINALAAQSAAQGQQMLNNDQANANQYKALYGDYQTQADAANKNVSNYATAMQGAYDPTRGTGNAGSTYNYDLNDQLGRVGYNQNEMTAARGNLNQATGALSAYSDFANTSASKFGLNAGGFAAANAGALGGLNNNIASNQGVVNSLSDLYKTAQTGANQFTGNVIQGQHETLGGLQAVFTNATNQRDSAASQLQFYEGLAAQQGHLNSQQQSDYAAAAQAYAGATQAQAEAAYYGSQTALAQQKYNQLQSLYANQNASSGPLAYAQQHGGSPFSPQYLKQIGYSSQ